MPFDGKNPHSIVVMDNCTIHHVPEIRKSIEDVGALLIFLPPYSRFRRLLESVEEDMPDIETLVLTPEDCQGWIFHSGIY